MISIIRFILVWTLLYSNAFATINMNNSQYHINLDNFSGVSCDISGNLCVAIGQQPNSHLSAYKSQDGGLTWNMPIEFESTTPIINKIACNGTGEHCIIVTLSKKEPLLTLYQTYDAGISWSPPLKLALPKEMSQYTLEEFMSDISCDYSGLNCVIASTIYTNYATAIPFIYTTKDAGKNWTLVSNLPKPLYSMPDTISLRAVTCNQNGNRCIVAGESITRGSFWSIRYTIKPLIYVSEDGGEHWENPIVVPGPATHSGFEDLYCNDSSQQCTALVYTVDLNTDQFQFFSVNTIDGGLHWENSNFISSSSPNDFLTSLDCDSSGLQCLAIGGTSTVKGFEPLAYFTDNSGNTWEKLTISSPYPSSYLESIFCSKTENRCLALGSHQDEVQDPIAQNFKIQKGFSPVQKRSFLIHRLNKSNNR